MATVRPFRALRPAPEKVAEVAAVPYDVVNAEEAAELAQGNPLSFLRVSRSEIDLDSSVDPYSAQIYSKAKENFDRLIRQAPLLTEATPSLYVYRLEVEGRAQTGIVGAYSIDEYDQNLIKKHERTRQDKEDDRTRHLTALGAQTGPVFLTYRGKAGIRALVDETVRGKPLYEFTAVDGVKHTVWTVSEPAKLVREFASVPALYIADGHHRAASAARVRKEMAAKNAAHTGNEEYNFVLAVAFASEELRILPYNRVLKDLNGLDEAGLLGKLREKFEVKEGVGQSPARGEFSMYLAKKWYGLKPRKDALAGSQGVIESLDVSVLQRLALDPLFSIKDPRTDKRIDFVGGIRGTKELVRLVDSGKAAVAFSLHATTLDDLMAVSDAGEIMPPKSTWFEPKLRDGLLSHWLHEG